MGTHGMYGLSEMLSGGQPLDPFMTPQQVTDTSSFFRWLEQREGEMTILAEARDAELTSWAAGHVAAFKMVRHLLHCYSASDISGMSRHFLSGYEGALRRKMHITFTGVKSGEAHDLALGNSAVGTPWFWLGEKLVIFRLLQKTSEAAYGEGYVFLTCRGAAHTAWPYIRRCGARNKPLSRHRLRLR